MKPLSKPIRFAHCAACAFVMSMLLAFAFSCCTAALAGEAQDEAVWEFLYGYSADPNNKEAYDSTLITRPYVVGQLWTFASGQTVELKLQGICTGSCWSSIGIMQLSEGITPGLMITGVVDSYIDFIYYELLIGDDVWTVDLTNTPLYSLCYRDENENYRLRSYVPLGNAGVQMLKALNETNGAYALRLYVTGTEFYESSADPALMANDDYYYFYQGLVQVGYIDENGDISQNNAKRIAAVDEGVSFPKVTLGALANTVAGPAAQPQSVLPEGAVAYDGYYVGMDEKGAVNQMRFLFKNVSEQKIIDRVELMYYFLDSARKIVNVDGREVQYQTVGNLNAAPGECFGAGQVSIDPQQDVKNVYVVITRYQFTDGSEVVIPPANHYRSRCEAAANTAKIKLGPSGKAVLDVGQSLQITTAFTPKNPRTDIAWSSSAESVATVDTNGMVTGHSQGSAKITAVTANGKKAEMKILVTYLVHAMDVQGESKVTAGLSIPLTAVVTDPKAPANSKVAWSTSDRNIAAVSNTGKVTAKKMTEVSTVAITATAMDGSGVTAEKVVTVYPAASAIDIIGADGALLTNTTVEMKEGETLPLQANVLPAQASPTVKWSSSKEKIAAVSQDGHVTALCAGKATVTIKTDNGKTAKLTIQVAAAK